MENKEDIVNSPSFENLKSYTVFRRRAPPFHNSADIVLAQTSVIRNWHFKLVSSTTSRYWFVLYGTVNNSFIKSSLVTDVVEDVARTENSFYRLSGNMSAKCDPHRHFDKELLKKFQCGFPPNWRSLLESEIRRIVELEASLSAKKETSKTARDTNESKNEHQGGKSEDTQRSTDIKCNLKLDRGNPNVPKEDSCKPGAPGLLSAPSNVARARLSLEKKLIAQKTAEILCSDDENTLFVQESSERDVASNGGIPEGRQAVKEPAHKLEEVSEGQERAEASVCAADGGVSPARMEPLREAGDSGAEPQVAVVKKRVSFNTDDIQEIILGGTDSANSAKRDAPAVQMGQVADSGSEESKEAISEGTDGALQAQAVAQPRKRGRKKSVGVAAKKEVAKDNADTKSSDERKAGTRKRRRRLTMPTGFKT